MPWLSTHLGFMGNLRPRAMDDADIRDLLRWQADGARRAHAAGFDIVYVYAGMGYLPYEFLLPEYNRRTDAYGGSIENRVRLVREMLEVTRDAVGDKCAVALRDQHGRIARQAGQACRLRSARGGGPARRHPGSLGRQDGFQPDRLRALALLARRQPRADHQFREDD